MRVTLEASFTCPALLNGLSFGAHPRALSCMHSQLEGGAEMLELRIVK